MPWCCLQYIATHIGLQTDRCSVQVLRIAEILRNNLALCGLLPLLLEGECERGPGKCVKVLLSCFSPGMSTDTKDLAADQYVSTNSLNRTNGF